MMRQLIQLLKYVKRTLQLLYNQPLKSSIKTRKKLNCFKIYYHLIYLQ